MLKIYLSALNRCYKEQLIFKKENGNSNYFSFDSTHSIKKPEWCENIWKYLKLCCNPIKITTKTNAFSNFFAKASSSREWLHFSRLHITSLHAYFAKITMKNRTKSAVHKTGFFSSSELKTKLTTGRNSVKSPIKTFHPIEDWKIFAVINIWLTVFCQAHNHHHHHRHKLQQHAETHFVDFGFRPSVP